MQNQTESEAIMRKLYLLSKPMKGVQHLIGILSEENGEYQFEYKLGEENQKWWLCEYDYFTDYDKKYVGKEVDNFIFSFVPKPNDFYIKGFLKAANLESYDKWELLKYCGKYIPATEHSLSETLPEGVIIHEQLD
jgi:hypothetical protein